MSDNGYKNCEVRIWEVSYYLVDEEGDDIVDKDGNVRVFSDNGKIDVSTWAEWVDPDDLIEIEKPWSSSMDSSDAEMLQEQLRKFSPPQETKK